MFVGWDWASETHDVTVLDDQGQMIDRWALTHDAGGIDGTLHRLATHDPLTHVLNVGAFTERVSEELRRNRRYGRTGALLYLDLDNFKSMNDTHGHQTGDAVLRLVADALQRTVRQVDVVGRMGGDEFAVLMPETDGELAQAAARRRTDPISAV